MNQIAVFNGAGILDGSTTAMLYPAMPSDTYWLDGKQHPVEAHTWQHGQAVEAVQHFRKHRSLVNEQAEVEWLGVGQIAIIRYVSIHMVDGDKLSESDIAALGYPTHDAYQGDWGQGLSHRKLWLIYIHVEEILDAGQASTNTHQMPS